MLILASESPRRQQLLRTLGVPFEIESAAVEEIAALSNPREVPLRNAERKAGAVAARHPEDIVLGADTVIISGDRVIGKPRDDDDALAILLSLSGKTHEVITGLALIRQTPPALRSWIETTLVTFKSFDEATARHYLSLVTVLDKAGAYAIQEHGELIVDSINGSHENVVGLPLLRLKEELAALEQR